MTQYSYDAIFSKQRSSSDICFCIISASAGDILKWSSIDRLTPDNLDGIQRKRNDQKVRSIRTFFDRDPRNTIPTAITVALKVESTDIAEYIKKLEPGKSAARKISINVDPKLEKPGLIIDGQHRVLGIDYHDTSTLVNVVILLGADDAETAFQFLVINNKVSKVSPNHLLALKLAYQKDELEKRLTNSAKIRSDGRVAYLEVIDGDPDSPFRGRIKWPRNAEDPRQIPPNAFELALDYIGKQGINSSGELGSGNPEISLEFFTTLWNVVKTKWPAAWEEERSKLLSKVGIPVLTEYLAEGTIARIVNLEEDAASLADVAKISEHAGKVLERLEYDFWASNWEMTSLDTNSGRDLLKKSLKQIEINKRNGLPWAKSINILGKPISDG